MGVRRLSAKGWSRPRSSVTRGGGLTLAEVKLEVQVNGRSVGHVVVAGSASKRDLELAAVQHPEACQVVGDDTVKHVEIVPGVRINILT